MPAISLPEIKKTVLKKLEGLDIHLTYHNTLHTLDVLTQAERIALTVGQQDPQEMFLLKVAALYHDTGFLRTYRGHEKASCAIFLEDADLFGFDDREKEIIQGLIMATQVPQRPTGILQEIICDADLDYLGREDFYPLGDTLRREFLYFKIVDTNAAWENLQLDFFRTHHYHTQASKMQRESAKMKHFAELLAHAPD